MFSASKRGLESVKRLITNRVNGCVLFGMYQLHQLLTSASAKRLRRFPALKKPGGWFFADERQPPYVGGAPDLARAEVVLSNLEFRLIQALAGTPANALVVAAHWMGTLLLSRASIQPNAFCDPA